MTLNTQQEAKTPLRRRASTPLPLSSRGHQPGLRTAPSTSAQPQHPRLGHSASLNPPTRQPSPAPNDWSSESSDSEGSWEALYRVVLLGDPGVGKTSLASLFAGKQERDLQEQLGEDVYERTLTVDGEDTTLVVMDTWEAEKLVWHSKQDLGVGFSEPSTRFLSRPMTLQNRDRTGAILSLVPPKKTHGLCIHPTPSLIQSAFPTKDRRTS